MAGLCEGGNEPPGSLKANVSAEAYEDVTWVDQQMERLREQLMKKGTLQSISLPDRALVTQEMNTADGEQHNGVLYIWHCSEVCFTDQFLLFSIVELNIAAVLSSRVVDVILDLQTGQKIEIGLKLSLLYTLARKLKHFALFLTDLNILVGDMKQHYERVDGDITGLTDATRNRE
ncbi:hypothetical protein ANN_18046 [Periplaneta americana]|uniref:Uncharacterized protein n=1 Tax=Periplaneta americana TaxID=6978 RepID=A0ABQ8SMM9_PERAM|nr:hypothetical protein ANN_18046 [Periplaneta americana]